MTHQNRARITQEIEMSITYIAEKYNGRTGAGDLMADGSVRVSLLAEANGVRWRVAEMLRPSDAEEIARVMNAAQEISDVQS